MSELRHGVYALWRAVFGQPPPIEAAPRLLCDLLVRHLPAAPPYSLGREPEAPHVEPAHPDGDNEATSDALSSCSHAKASPDRLGGHPEQAGASA
jgi:hypothetical protein